MFHQVYASPYFIYSFIALSLKNQPVSAGSIGADTLKTIRSNNVYKFGYETAHKSHFDSFAFQAGLTRLAKIEQKIYKTLQQLNFPPSVQNSSLNECIKEYMDDYTATSVALTSMHNATEAEERAQVVAGNLVGAYRMVRRFRNFIQPLLAPSTQNSSSISQSELDVLRKNIRALLTDREKEGPDRRDFQLTVFAIVITQFQLEWKAEDIAKGYRKGMELGVTLDAVHSFEIGVHATASMMYPIGIEWLQFAALQVQNGDHSVQLSAILPVLEKAQLKHDIKWKPMNSLNLRATFYERRLNESREIKKELKWQRKKLIDFGSSTAGVDLERSWDVCSGKLLQTDSEKSKLFCWYETEIDPTWKIGPLKVELHSLVPLEVVQFHDVVGRDILEGIKNACPQGIARMKNDFNPKYRHSLICGTVRGNPVEDSLLKLTQRITGWSVAKAELIVPHSYPPGGYIRAHTDAEAIHPNSFKGRIATLLYHFDGPAIGGETGFQTLNLTVKAIKGSAVLWHNRFKSSEIHPDAVHSGCPVVQGHKWYAVVWLPYYDQTHLACDLDQNSAMEYYMNGKPKYLTHE